MTGETREYELELPYGMVHTVLLTDEEAARYGDRATPVAAKKSPAPANKARTGK